MMQDKTPRIARIALAGVLAAALLNTVAAQNSAIGECELTPSTTTSESSNALYRIDGASRSEVDLTPALQQALFDARLEHYKKQIALIDTAVLEDELERRAKREDKTRDALVRELFATAPPDDAAIARFYEQNKARIPYPIDKVRQQIRQMLMERARGAQRASFVAQVKRDRGFELALAKPVAPFAEIATEGFPSKGGNRAKVTIVEFADYQCPHCKSAAAALTKIAKSYGDKVRIVFADFPVNPSGISRLVAEGAACADRQGQFWPYHDLAFTRQSTLSHESATAFAAELGLDEQAFRSCLESSYPRERVAQGEAQARRFGLRSTPTLFLNGRRLHLHDIEIELPAEIDKILSGSSKS